MERTLYFSSGRLDGFGADMNLILPMYASLKPVNHLPIRGKISTHAHPSHAMPSSREKGTGSEIYHKSDAEDEEEAAGLTRPD